MLWSRIKAGTSFCFTQSFRIKILGSTKYYLSNYAASYARITGIWETNLCRNNVKVYHSFSCYSVVFHWAWSNLICNIYIKTSVKESPLTAFLHLKKKKGKKKHTRGKTFSKASMRGERLINRTQNCNATFNCREGFQNSMHQLEHQFWAS